jgi:hypothetical protein
MPEPNPAPEPEVTPNPGAFDPEAFMTKLMGEFDKRTNAMDKKLNKLADQLKQPKPVDPPADPATDPTTPQDPPKKVSEADLNAKLALLTRQIETLTQENMSSKKAAEEESKKRLEAERVAAFDAAIADIPFADAKARATFKKAYLPDVVRDEDGNLVAQTDKGPMAFAEYLKAEAESQPALLISEGHRGAGANAGKKAFGGQKIDIFNMSQKEIQALKPEVRDQLLAEAAAALAPPR